MASQQQLTPSLGSQIHHHHPGKHRGTHIPGESPKGGFFNNQSKRALRTLEEHASLDPSARRASVHTL